MVSTSILKSSGTSFGWQINQYIGCSHGCKYCYGIGAKSYADWRKAKPKENVTKLLCSDILKLKSSDVQIKDIFLGSATDSYQPLEHELKLTRSIVEILIKHELPFTVLTKSDLVLRDIDLFKNYKYCRVGLTLTSLDDSVRQELEPYSSSVQQRIHVLKTLKANNISTYVSCEPIFPMKEANPLDIVRQLKDVVDLFEFGMWNKYRTDGISSKYVSGATAARYKAMFSLIGSYCKQHNINYCTAVHSKAFIEQQGLDFKQLPLVKA
jgi:DNA repair photolyase